MPNQEEQRGLDLFEAARRFNVPFNKEVRPRSIQVGTGGLDFHCLEWGEPEGPAILLLHGVAQQAHSWDFVSLALADRFRVVAMDARGHGDSQWPPDGDYSIEAHQSDLDAFVDALGLRDFILIGHSMGGRSAYVFASRRPELLKALVIVDTGPQTTSTGARRIRQFVTLPDALDSYEEFALRVQEYTGRPAWMVHGSLQHAIRQMPNGKWSWKYDKAIRSPDFNPPTWPADRLWQCLESISCPVMVVRGANSDVFAEETMDRMMELIPDCSGAVVPNAGHLVPGDNTKGFLDAIEPLLKRVG